MKVKHLENNLQFILRFFKLQLRKKLILNLGRGFNIYYIIEIMSTRKINLVIQFSLVQIMIMDYSFQVILGMKTMTCIPKVCN